MRSPGERITLLGRATGAAGRTIRFADGHELDADTVVWATGYRPGYSRIHAPVLSPDGPPRHRRGVTGSPGLCFGGMHQRYSRGSSLIYWVRHDAPTSSARSGPALPLAEPAPETAMTIPATQPTAQSRPPARRRRKRCPAWSSPGVRRTCRHGWRTPEVVKAPLGFGQDPGLSPNPAVAFALPPYSPGLGLPPVAQPRAFSFSPAATTCGARTRPACRGRPAQRVSPSTPRAPGMHR